MRDTGAGPGRPDADECLPYYFQYIDLVPAGHVVGLLERQIAESAKYLAGFTPEQASRREAPAEWNAVEIVGHLADVERVFNDRALRIARADPVMWTTVEFDGYAAAANFQDRPLEDVVAKVKELSSDTGFNAATETYENLTEAGVIDPTKVVRFAIQNAASIAGLLLTTEAVVAEIPEKKSAPAMPPGGGMEDY